MNLKRFEVQELLQLQASITTELMERGVVRTRNNPLGDYAEWIVARALNLTLARNSEIGYDAISKRGIRFQIKSRRITAKNKSRQLSAIRKLNEKDFDKLAAVIFDEDFNVIDAVLMPHEVVEEYSVYKEHVNAHILHLKGPILYDSRVKSIKKKIESNQI